MRRQLCICVSASLLSFACSSAHNHPHAAAKDASVSDADSAVQDGSVPWADASPWNHVRNDAGDTDAADGVGARDAAAAGGGEAGTASQLPTLLGLTASGATLVPAFDPQVMSYALVLPLAIDTVQLTALSASDQTITIDGQSVASGEPWQSPKLMLGDNSVAVAVDAADGHERIYTVVVTRSTLPLRIDASAAGGTDFAERVALSGDTLAIVGRRDDGCAIDLWVHEADAFRLQAHLELHDPAGDPQSFGNAISMAIDVDTLVIGAVNEDGPHDGNGDNTLSGAGAAYVFVRQGGSWTQTAHLRANQAGAGDSFGESVAVSGDTIVVGAPGEDVANVIDSGAAHVFVRQADNWSEQARLTASNAETGDYFGASVAVSGDTTVIGAASEDSAASGVNGDQNDNSAADSGAAYVFERSQAFWMQRAYLKATKPNPSIAPLYGGDGFGGGESIAGPKVAIWNDRVVVGAPGEDGVPSAAQMMNGVNSIGDSGAVYLFVRNADGWNYETRLEAQYRVGGADFGSSVALWGSRLIVGAWQSGGLGAGVNVDPMMSGLIRSGAAYTFAQTSAGWTQRAYLKSSAPIADEDFGWSVAIFDNMLVVGAPAISASSRGLGAAYAFPGWTDACHARARPESAANGGGGVAWSSRRAGIADLVRALTPDSPPALTSCS
jgi:hypothetical protein